MFYKNKTNTTCQKKKKMKQQSNSVYHDKKKNTKSTTNWQKKMRFQNKRHLEFERAKRKKLEEGKERNRKGKRTNDMCVCGEELSLIRECFTSCVCTWSVKCECCESVVSVFCKYVRWMIQSKKKKKNPKRQRQKKKHEYRRRLGMTTAWMRDSMERDGMGWDGMIDIQVVFRFWSWSFGLWIEITKRWIPSKYNLLQNKNKKRHMRQERKKRKT